METYLVITGDIIGSKSRESQSELAGLPETIDHLNGIYSDRLISGFALSAGDEIQGVFPADVSVVYRCLIDIYGALLPLRIRAGLGIGTISTDILPDPGQMRGEAFERARNALEEITKPRTFFRMRGPGEYEHWLNTIFLLLSRILHRWKPLTYRRYSLYREAGDIFTVAEKENVSHEAINKYLGRYDIREVLDTLTFLESQHPKLKLSTPIG